MPSPLTTWSQSIFSSIPSMAAPWPPRTMTDAPASVDVQLYQCRAHEQTPRVVAPEPGGNRRGIGASRAGELDATAADRHDSLLHHTIGKDDVAAFDDDIGSLCHRSVAGVLYQAAQRVGYRGSPRLLTTGGPVTIIPSRAVVVELVDTLA